MVAKGQAQSGKISYKVKENSGNVIYSMALLKFKYGENLNFD